MAAATPPVTPVSFHHGVLDDPHVEEQKQLHCGVHALNHATGGSNYLSQHLDYAAEVYVVGVNAATMTPGVPTATAMAAACRAAASACCG